MKTITDISTSFFVQIYEKQNEQYFDLNAFLQNQ